jgi:hypothetical protein
LVGDIFGPVRFLLDVVSDGVDVVVVFRIFVCGVVELFLQPKDGLQAVAVAFSAVSQYNFLNSVAVEGLFNFGDGGLSMDVGEHCAAVADLVDDSSDLVLAFFEVAANEQDGEGETAEVGEADAAICVHEAQLDGLHSVAGYF